MTMTTNGTTQTTETSTAQQETAQPTQPRGEALSRYSPTAPIAAIGDDMFRGGLEPAGFADAAKLSKLFSDIEFCGAKTPADALARIMFGRELGWGAVQSMRNVYVVYGRPCLDAAAMVALCKQSPLCEEFTCVETEDTHATYRVKRRGSPAVTRTFRIEEAQRAQLVKKDSNWEKWPKNMCRARCCSNIANEVFPDVTRGMRTREESEEEMIGEVVQVAPRHVAQAQARDFDAEKSDLLRRIAEPLTKVRAAEIRRAIHDWDAPSTMKDAVVAAYDVRMKAVQGAQQPPAQPAGRQPGEDDR